MIDVIKFGVVRRENFVKIPPETALALVKHNLLF
jgi:hypothetical protein